jgi:pimeloyl-ACP methyl ester carboxylesterase
MMNPSTALGDRTAAATVVLTNGAWHGAWCWSAVLPHLVAAGVPATPVELEGFSGLRGGSRAARHARPWDATAFAAELSAVAGVTLESAVEQLLDDLDALAPALVVAHSLGGTVVAAAAERAPRLFSGLLFVSAMVPVAGQPASAYNALPEMADSRLAANFVADPAVVARSAATSTARRAERQLETPSTTTSRPSGLTRRWICSARMRRSASTGRSPPPQTASARSREPGSCAPRTASSPRRSSDASSPSSTQCQRRRHAWSSSPARTPRSSPAPESLQRSSPRPHLAPREPHAASIVHRAAASRGA